MSDEISIQEEDIVYFRKVLAAFYNDGYAMRFDTINEDVIEVMGEMISRSADCTAWMDYVPKPITPPGSKPGIKWSLRQIRKIGKGLINSTEKHNFTCLTSVAWAFRGKLERAQYGV